MRSMTEGLLQSKKIERARYNPSGVFHASSPCTGEPKSRAVQIARDFSLQNTLAIFRQTCYNKKKDYRERNPK